MCLNIHMQSFVCRKLAFKKETVRQPRELRFALLDFEKSKLDSESFWVCFSFWELQKEPDGYSWIR